MKICLTVFFLSLSIAVFSQDYKKLRLAIEMGYGAILPPDFNNQYEFSFVGSLEPSYRLNDQISVGIRLEAIGQIVGGGMNVASCTGNFQY